MAMAQSTWRAEWENEASTEGIRTFGCRPDARKRNSPPLVPSAAPCFARNWGEGARDAEGRVVGREHERVRRRMTGQSPKTGQRLIHVVTGDQSTDSHLEADVDVRVTSPLCFSEREGGAVALASRAQATSRNVGLREGGGAKSADHRCRTRVRRAVCPQRCLNNIEMEGPIGSGVFVAFHERPRRHQSPRNRQKLQRRKEVREVCTRSNQDT